MLVCDRCRRQLGNDQPERSKSFPAFTLLGGLLSTAGAGATGMLILVPAGVVLGALADASGQRCGMCKSRIGQEEPAYHLMEELGDDMAGRSYRPVQGATSPEQGPRHATPDRSAQSQYPGLSEQHARSGPWQTTQDKEDMCAATTFREHEGKLIPAEPHQTDNHDGLGLVDTPITGLDPEPDGRQLFRPGGEIMDLTNDDFTVFGDPTTQIDVLDGLEDSPWGDCDHE